MTWVLQSAQQKGWILAQDIPEPPAISRHATVELTMMQTWTESQTQMSMQFDTIQRRQPTYCKLHWNLRDDANKGQDPPVR
ncbi:MAG: hypothetical protein CM15mP9_0160 [Methanobacteriota archaeon]|nr:MAG: hypothetical protein CM15mP9_0160 [Euryarchaeota archaeon]